MGKPIHTICCVMELETKEMDDDCPDCTYKSVETLNVYEGNQTYYDAKTFISTANLQSYRFDDGLTTPVVGGYPANGFVRIDYPPENSFHHLCVNYNREGDPRINVVAVNQFTGEKIRPSKPGAKSEDWTFPIESASIIGIEFEAVEVPVGQFQWADGQPTVFLDELPGAWTIAPPAWLGDMKLNAKAYLEIEPGMPEEEKFKFLRWERNRLSNWVTGTKHHWSGHDEGIDGDTIEFGINTYTGVLAYYIRPIDIPPGRVDTDYYLEVPNEPGKGGPYTPGPEGRIRWPILWPLLQVWRRIVVFVKDVFGW
jgi:hypothetical protein